MIKTKKQMYIVIGAFALVLLLGGVTYAFFNYTRTGTINIIKTGRISFNSTQGQAINLTNMFPIDVSGGIPNDNTKVGTVTINVTGDTTYNDGIEYRVSAVNVQNTIGSGANAKTLPISIDVSVTNNTTNDPATTLGTADSNYYTNRGGNSSIYKILAGETITNNDELLVGYITKGATGVDGNIVIKAYFDESKILVSDTYNNGNTPTDNLGTPASLGEGKTVFTTTEWNSLQTNGVSFQIKVESNEGIWLEAPVPPIPTIESCPGCKFMYAGNEYEYGGASNQSATSVLNLTGVTTDYRTLNRNYFIGFTETGDGKIDRAFACGIKSEAPNNGEAFCVEGSTSGSVYSGNNTFLRTFYGLYSSTNNHGCTDYGDSIVCGGDVEVTAYDDGYASVSNLGSGCSVDSDNTLFCN